MIKKLLCIALTVVMLCSFFVMDAGAAIATAKTYVDEDFTLPEGADGAEWRPEGWSVGGLNGLIDLVDQGIYNITEEGYVELCKGGYTGGACVWYTFPTLPNEYSLMFDVRYPETSGYTGTLYVDCSINGFRQNLQPGGGIAYADDVNGEAKNIGAGAHDANTWYTYVFQVKGDRMSVYRKSEYEQAFTQKADNVKMQLRSGNQFYAYSTSSTAYIHIDNVKVFTGTYLKKSEITINEEKTMITGTTDVTSAEVMPSGSDFVTAVMTACDAKGKVVDIAFESFELMYDDNNSFSVKMPITPDIYESMSGGKVELYLWDNFDSLIPRTSAYIIDIQ